jgi:hypothetical protein
MLQGETLPRQEAASLFVEKNNLSVDLGCSDWLDAILRV